MERSNSAARSVSAPTATPTTIMSPTLNFGQLDDEEGDYTASSDENDESDTEDLDPNWKVGGITIDSRYISGLSNK